MNAAPRRPPGLLRALLLLGGLVAVSALALDWNLEVLSGARELRAAFDRAAGYLGAFLRPELSGPMLARGLHLTLETLSVALLGTGLGLLLGWPIALGASAAVVLGGEPARGAAGLPRRLLLQCSRLLLDVLRGVPDFAWAIVIANFTGTNAVTGTLAIGISVAGILGKVLSEQWDNVDPRRYDALRSTGAGHLQVFLYGLQPLAGRATLSFVLMRAECAVRNASVIGVVGGGGLGAGLWDEYTDGSWSRVATLLLFMLATTASVDLAANWMRSQLRTDPDHPRARRSEDRRSSARRRRRVALALVAVLAGAALVVRAPLARVAGELGRLEPGFVRDYTASLLLQPDLSPETLWLAARSSVVPLALAVVATAVAVLLAGALAWPGSVAFQLEAQRFFGERQSPWLRARRLALVVAARGLGLVLRGVPEVAWVVLLGVFFQAGLTPCAVAVVLHGTGVLQRVFTEAVDDVPYGRLERVPGARRAQVFAYGALPEAWRDWKTYAFFQFEVNVRIGVVLGMVGAGGLGDKFQSNLLFRENHRACTLLWTMVLLTAAIDRLSRRLLQVRRRC